MQAVFVKSSERYDQLPAPDLPEFAFVGRSNVGKSSLINLLTGRKDLAKTSATPGKTQLINHFRINESWYWVDLPGYGYARVSNSQRVSFLSLVWDYLRQRPTLFLLLVLIDLRHAPMARDLEFLQRLGEEGIPFALVFTKADKLSKSQQQKALETYNQKLAESWDPLPTEFVTSSVTGQGREELLGFVESLLKSKH